MIKISQTDRSVLPLVAMDGPGRLHDLTGATFESRIIGADGTVIVYDDAHHAITDAANGKYTLTLSSAETALLALGAGHEITTKVTQSGNPVTFHGFNALQVFKATPEV